MIISHKHKFIFLHCRKVAGSSMTAMLNRFLGPDDIQIGNWQDTIAAGGKYNHKVLETILLSGPARAYLLKKLLVSRNFRTEKDLSRIVAKSITRAYSKQFSPVSAHLTASMVKQHFPTEWSEYFKFCFARNPYHHAVSDYWWKARKLGDKAIAFEEFLKRKADPSRPDPEKLISIPLTNWDIYTINDTVAVDYLGKFESLAQDLSHIGTKLGLDFSETLPNFKTEHRKSNFVELYDETSKRLVEEIYHKELAHFDYRFG